MKKQLITLIAVMMAGGLAFADWISDESIESATSAWLSSDRVAQLTMKGLSFDRLVHRGSLRIVHLSPNGYIIISGSDTVDPVISFSRNRFGEPDEGSPFHAMLEHSSSDVGKHEMEGGGRTAKWAELIGNRDGSKPSAKRLMAADAGEEPSTILIEPFMTTHWNQCQPWNDFVPLCFTGPDDPDYIREYYRSRCPCGCVATAAAQQIAHFRWPWYTGTRDLYNHPYNRDGEGDAEESFLVRFDGHVPFEWDLMLDTYSWWWGDARGKVDERERYPIGRFILWADQLTRMGFGKNGSGASFASVRETASDWYELWEDVDLVNNYDDSAAKVRADLAAGIPVHVGVPGHAVVAHGWASDGEYDYVYLNYGWGGSNDGWYILDGRNADTPITGAGVGFRPRKMVQLEPFPNVCDGNVSVKWHLPQCYDNDVRGFQVKAIAFGDAIENEMCDFSTSRGIASNTGSTFVTNGISGVSNDTDLLWWDPCAAGTYDLPGERMLTTRSVLTYRLSSSYVGDGKVEILASFDLGEWQTISTPVVNKTSWSDLWTPHSVFLGDEAGKTARFRIKVSRTGGGYWFERRLLFDDFSCGDVILPSTVFDQTFEPDSRSCLIGGLDAGTLVGVSVKPLFDGDDGIVSLCQYTRICGTARISQPPEDTNVAYKDVNLVYVAGDPNWGLRGSAEGDSTIKAFNAWSGGFDIALPGLITDRSKLSFSWYENGYYGSATAYDTISATFVDESGVETNFWKMTNRERQKERQFVELSLAEFAGKSGEVKIVFGHSGSNYTGDGDIMRFYSPWISNIAVPVLPELRWKSQYFEVLPSPRIDSVKGRDGLDIDEGLYREIGIGEDCLRVTCSETVTSLRAYPSHLSLVDDGDVTVERTASGEFLVRMNTAKAVCRSRMILTLAAADRNGTTAYRDVSVRFDDASSVDKLYRWVKLETLFGKPLCAFTFDKSNKENSGAGSMEIGGGNVSYVESPLGHALYHNGDDGPWITSDRSQDMPNEWTVLTIARLSDTDNAVLYQFGSSGYGHSGFAIASGGKDKVTLSHWSPRVRHTDLLTVNVSNAATQYHSYVLRAKGRFVEMFVDGILAGSATLPSMPKLILQIFSIIAYSGNTGLINDQGERMDDWRMYDVALPDAAIAAYANTLLLFDQEKAGIGVGDVVVPERWFRKYYPSGTMSRAALSAKAANGRSVWECYAAGLDPTDAEDDLVADITFVNGVPKVAIANGEKSDRTYRVLATKALDDSEPPLDVTDVPDLSIEPYRDYHFFRVSVELP